jgi:hypothetical protein
MSPDTEHVLPSKWKGFLREIDQLLGDAVEMHCLGGFVLSALYDLPRPTGDVDYIAAMPSSSITELESIAGQGSALSRKHGLYLQYVTVADVQRTTQSGWRNYFRASSSGFVSLHWKCMISFSPSWFGTAQLTWKMPSFSPGQDG